VSARRARSQFACNSSRRATAHSWDVAQSRAIDGAGDDATVEVHGSPRSRVMGMEVRHGAAAFIPVHIDLNSSEVADSRHARMLASYSRPAQNYSDLVPEPSPRDHNLTYDRSTGAKGSCSASSPW